MYKISKIINNNIVCSKDSNGKEIILRGLGIGFGKKANDVIDEQAVEKVYKMSNSSTSNKLQELLSDLPIEYVSTCTDIIEYAKKNLNTNINENIYVTLTDHISFAIERKYKNLEYENPMLFEIKRFYQDEYNIAKHAITIIKQKLGVQLSDDEAGFIALHIVNAELGTDMPSMLGITEHIKNIVGIVQNYYGLLLDENSLYYERFIVHLKFLLQRLTKDIYLEKQDIEFQKIVRLRYPNEYNCALLIKKYISDKYNKNISEEEMLYLTVHLKRIIP